MVEEDVWGCGSRAILLDLDGTLLDNPMDVFLPLHFSGLAQCVSSLLPPDGLRRVQLDGSDLPVRLELVERSG